MKDPIFIQVDGADGSGKGTLIKNVLETWDSEKNGPIKAFYDPGVEDGHPMGVIRSLVKNTNMTPQSEVLLFQACRLELWDSISDALDMGINVICDRGPLSTWVYQGVVKGQGDLVNILNQVFKPNIIPDVDIVCHAPFEVINERLKGRFESDDPNMDKFKYSEMFRYKVWKEYSNCLSNDLSLIKLDTIGTEEDVIDYFYDILEYKKLGVVRK